MVTVWQRCGAQPTETFDAERAVSWLGAFDWGAAWGRSNKSLRSAKVD